MKKDIPSLLPTGCLLVSVFLFTMVARVQAASAPKVVLGDPVVVAQAPSDEPQPSWGRWQFPGIHRLADGRLLVQWSIHIDSAQSYGAVPAGAVSSDGGKTWRRISPSEAERLVCDIRLSNGESLKVAQEPAVPIGEVKNLPEPIEDVGPFWKPRLRRAHYQFYLRTDFSGKMSHAYPLWRKTAGASTWVKEYPKVDIPGQVLWQREGVLVRPFFQAPIVKAPDSSLWTSSYWPRLLDGAVTRYVSTYVHSTDAGHTWHCVSQIPQLSNKSGDPGPYLSRDYCEASLAFAPDGSMITLIRDSGPSLIAHSTDNGKHWSNPETFDHFGVDPQLLVLKCGVTIASYGRPGVRIRASSDPAATQWDEPIDIPLPKVAGRLTCGYTSLVALSKDQGMLVYSAFGHPDGHGKSRKAIVVRTITVSNPRNNSTVQP